MRRFGRILVVVALAIGSSPALATAQRAGAPVDHSPAHIPVIGFHIDFAQGSGYAGSGSLRSLGGRLHATTGRIQLLVGGHAVSPDATGLEDGFGVQAAVAVQVREARPTWTTNAQAGIGYVRLDAGAGDLTLIDIPLSLSFGLYAPTPAGPAEVWGAPRVHFRHTSLPGGAGDGLRVGPGASVGLRFTLADAQAGFSLGLDALALRDPADDGWRFLGSFGLGLHLLLLR